jgi:hypothetical protein
MFNDGIAVKLVAPGRGMLFGYFSPPYTAILHPREKVPMSCIFVNIQLGYTHENLSIFHGYILTEFESSCKKYSILGVDHDLTFVPSGKEFF